MSELSINTHPPVLRTLAEFPAATVYEALGKCGGMSPDVRPMIPRSRLCGPAFTVRTLGCESAAVLHAIEQAPQGSVLVIDTGGRGTSAIWGGSSTLAAVTRGLKGLVTNGLIRDLDEIEDLKFPVYAAGTTVSGTLKSHPGWIGEAVVVGGVMVHPGDIILGDSDGVVVVPAALVTQAVDAASAQRTKELARDARLRAGEPITVVLGLRAG
ncbi:MAG: RraA family protein [Burkholderiaceae bacterium]